MSLDLTPFGFTQTEGLVFGCLQEQGPSSGYSVARVLSIARANAYQALDGLVGKGAAQVTGENPKLYRATSPTGLLSLVAQQQSRQLEHLERSLENVRDAGSSSMHEFHGEREFGQLVLRMATRSADEVHFLGPAGLAGAQTPIWRKRDSDGRRTAVWVIGSAGPDLQARVAGTVSEEGARREFGSTPALLAAGGATILGFLDEDGLAGHWSTDPLLIGTARSAIRWAADNHGIP